MNEDDLILQMRFQPPGGVTHKGRRVSVWSTNMDRNLHHHNRGRLISQWKTVVGWELRRFGRPREQVPIRLSVSIPFERDVSRVADPHNYCGTVLKVIADALVEWGLIPNDTGEWMGHTEPKLVKGRWVTVTVRRRDE